MSPALSITEHDDAGALLTTYIYSPSSRGSRIDIIHPPHPKASWKAALDVFLPAGYPGSDSLQAFASSIAGMLSSRAVLEGVGVGDSTASPTAALLLNVLQESMGRIATILFAHRLGTALEPECKMYRLAADIFNDAAMVLDCLSPAFPKPVRVLVLAGSSVLRSLCGVAAGSAKASLSAHFAQRGNLGELNAAGSVVVSWVRSAAATWSVLVLLLAVHLGMNHQAVRAVSMRTLNRQRANIVLGEFMSRGRVLKPKEVSGKERVFERDGVLRWVDGRVLGYGRIGVDLQTLLQRLGPRHATTGAVQLDSKLSALAELYRDEAYMLWFDVARSEALIVLKQDSTPVDQLKAWTQALMVASRPKEADSLSELRMTLQEASKTWKETTEKLAAAGWDLEVAALETRPGRRVRMA
ncbi:DUF647-domain-containing protein [Mytilinidion resinicola]|uniref:DUF647-domain-containing protein n=1 Tax=Mytilinidion resinicola TaxID=574789 RepID=A0A6A6YLQ9_9PEZI|nr:DUF647-domain-containing protein [Mytilinidion resinicola]KAF2809740.1 DUF647-domain-containing protein [Mytilinidion resinicola]